MAPVLRYVPRRQVFDFKIPYSLLLIPGGSYDFMTQFNVLVQLILSRYFTEIF
jgi:hypothetical protein